MDLELLEDISFAERDYDDPVARDAFGRFYQRHAAWLYRRLCRTGVFQLLEADGVQDVVQETFYRAYKGAKTFNPGFVTDDPSRLEAAVRAWLGGIANRVIADMLRGSKPCLVEPFQLEPGQAAWRADADESTTPSPIIRALQEQLQKLSPLQQDVLAAAALYFQADTTYQRLPNGVAKKLVEKHGTSSNNIRQVRRRTMADLRKKLMPLLNAKSA